MFEIRKKFPKIPFFYYIYPVLEFQVVLLLSLQRQPKSKIIKMAFIILSFIDSKQSIMSSLSERLTQLRGLIADSANTSTLLFETDKIISLEKQLRSKRNQNGVDALQQQIKNLKGKLKNIRKEGKSRQETIENLKMDLEMMRVKCRNFEERVKEHNISAAREKRAEKKRKGQNYTECEIKVNLLTQGKIDERMRNIGSEIFENQNLGYQLEELRAREQTLGREESQSSNKTRDEQDIFKPMSLASFSGSFATATPSNPETEDIFNQESLDARLNVKNQLWTMSKQITNYFKEQ